MADDAAWQKRWQDAVTDFGRFLKAEDELNPWPHHPLLRDSMMYLMTELWSRGFRESEIRAAFAEAIEALPDFAAGLDHPGVPCFEIDEKRKR